MHRVGEPLGHLETRSFGIFYSNCFSRIPHSRGSPFLGSRVLQKYLLGLDGVYYSNEFSSKYLQFGMFVFSLQLKKNFHVHVL